MCWQTCQCAVVGAGQVDRAVACAGVGWKTACQDNRGAGGVAEVAEVDVAGVEDVVVDVVVGAVAGGAVDVDVVVVVVVAADVAVAAEGVGRKDTCWDSSVGCQRQSAVLACKTGQGRWNIQRQKQIAIAIGSASVRSSGIESVSAIATETAREDGRGRNGPGRGGLACLRRDEWKWLLVAKKGQARARVRGEVRSKC